MTWTRSYYIVRQGFELDLPWKLKPNSKAVGHILSAITASFSMKKDMRRVCWDARGHPH